jgi:hypothetical protein
MYDEISWRRILMGLMHPMSLGVIMFAIARILHSM